jgi:hypothetical protein
MANPSVLRLLSIAATLAFVWLSPTQEAYLAGVFGLGMAHYVSSFVYSGRQLHEFKTGARSRVALALLLMFGALILVWPRPHSPKLVYYFAIHHVFNEVYLMQRSRTPGRSDSIHIALASAFHFVVYFCVLVNDEFLVWSAPFLKPHLLGPTLGVVSVAYAASLVRTRDRIAPRDFLGVSVSELAVATLAVASLANLVYVQYLDIVMYHFVFWAIYPLTKFARRAPGPLAWKPVLRFVGTNVGLLVAFTSMAAPYVTPAPGGPVWGTFFLLSYLHITTAFALSTAFPTWITRWFQPVTSDAVAGLRIRARVEASMEAQS